MAQALNDIRATIPVRRLGRIGLERRIVKKNHVPEFQPETHAERPLHVVFLVWLADRRDAMHQIGIKRMHVVCGSLGKRRVGHRRIKIMAVRSNAFTHGTVKLLKGVAADSIFDIGGDIGGINDAKRRIQT